MTNIFADLPDASKNEIFEIIAEKNGVRIERIVSHGQATPECEWYDQDCDEWVLLLSGSAEILFADDQHRTKMNPGDYILISAHQRHRVAWTEPEGQTVWLALHFPPHAGNS